MFAFPFHSIQQVSSSGYFAWKEGMVKLEILLDEPSIDLSIRSETRSASVPLSGRLVLTIEKPIQIKVISLKYECINSHVDLQVPIPLTMKLTLG